MHDARRRFTIADGMFLVAATALALVAARATLVDMRVVPPTLWAWVMPKLTWVGLAFTLALIPIRLFRSRPDREDLWRQPGWVACVSVAISLMVSLFQHVLTDATVAIQWANFSFRAAVDQVFQDTLHRLPFHAVIVVSATWTILVMGGQWQAEPGWIDRAGRAIGVYWLVISVVDWCSMLFP